MIIYNTTYNVNIESVNEFIEWIKTDLIPTATASGELLNPQLALIMASEDDKTKSYSLQFRANSIEDLQNWYQGTGKAKIVELENRFTKKVVGFSTLMTVLDI